MSKITTLFTRERIRSIVGDLLIELTEAGEPDAFFIVRNEYRRRLQLAGLPLDNFFNNDAEKMLDVHLEECKDEFENATIKLDHLDQNQVDCQIDRDTLEMLRDSIKDIQTSVDVLVEQAFNEDAVTSLSLARVINVAIRNLTDDFEMVM